MEKARRTFFGFVAAAMLVAIAPLKAIAKPRTLGPTGGYQVKQYDANDFGATNGMTWSQPTNPVDPGDPPSINSFRYKIEADGMMHLQVDAIGGTVGGNRQNSFLWILLPEGRYARCTMQVPCMAKDNNGNWELCYCLISKHDQRIYFRRASEASWSAQTNLRLDLNVVLETVEFI